MDGIDVREYDVKALAYIGDAVYEVYVRKYIMSHSREQVSKLHKKAVKYVSAKAQACVIENMLDKMKQDMLAVFKRGRNAAANTVPKNTDVVTYKIATGFEAVVGFLYLTQDTDRLDKFIFNSFEIIEKEYIK